MLCWKKSSDRSGLPVDNKASHNAMVFCPLQSQCPSVQGGESAAAGKRLHFNYGAGCSGAAAGVSIINDKGSSNIHIDQVPPPTIALTITTQGTLAIFITFEWINTKAGNASSRSLKFHNHRGGHPSIIIFCVCIPISRLLTMG